jgi:FkbM family methyltransferase
MKPQTREETRAASGEEAPGGFGWSGLRDAFVARARQLQRDPWMDVPGWARADPQHALSGKKFVICGSNLRSQMRHVVRHRETLAIVDDFLYQKVRELYGVPVISTEMWLSMAKKDPSIVSLILVASATAYNHFMRCCIEQRLPVLTALQYFRLSAPASDLAPHARLNFMYGLNFFSHAVENFDALARCADVFDDDFSRFTLLSHLNFRLTGDPNHLWRCAIGYNTDRYGYDSYLFNRSFFEFGEDEVFVDGGGFDGDSIEQFLRAVRGRFRHLYCFEPSPEFAQKILQRIRHLQTLYVQEIGSRIDIVPKGLWDCATRLTFNPSQFAAEDLGYEGSAPLGGHLVDSGITDHIYRPEEESAVGFSIDTASIDETCTLPVSFIKLEIEGSELQALQGAAATIAKSRPKLAISIYHKPEDYLTLTRFVSDTGLGYKMSLRQHNPQVPDATVCYCY